MPGETTEKAAACRRDGPSLLFLQVSHIAINYHLKAFPEGESLINKVAFRSWEMAWYQLDGLQQHVADGRTPRGTGSCM